MFGDTTQLSTKELTPWPIWVGGIYVAWHRPGDASCYEKLMVHSRTVEFWGTVLFRQITVLLIGYSFITTPTWIHSLDTCKVWVMSLKTNLLKWHVDVLWIATTSLAHFPQKKWEVREPLRNQFMTFDTDMFASCQDSLLLLSLLLLLLLLLPYQDVLP